MKSLTCLFLALCTAAVLRSEDAAPPPASTAPAVIAPILRGLRLTPDLSATGPVPAGIELHELPLLEGSGLQATLAARLGHPLRMTDIAAMIADIKRAYEKLGRPFVEVGVPAQDITSGELTLVVIESRLGAVKLEGRKWFSESSYLAQLHLVPGQPIDQFRLNADLDWLARAGHRSATIQAVPGGTHGTTDLLLEVQEQRPWQFNVGYADAGTASTDDERITAGVLWDNAFGRGQELSYQLTASPDLHTSVAHSGSYTAPLDRWHHVFRADGVWSTIHADIPAPFNSKGYSWQIGLNYLIPLRDFRLGPGLTGTHSLTAALDVKETNNNIEFSSEPVTDNTTQIFQARATYEASVEDRLGRTAGSLTGVFSPGGLTSRNSDAAFAGSRSGAEAEYAYLILNLRRDIKLPHDFAYVFSFTGQISSANLLGSEQLGLGGAHSVRGYDEGLVYGDEGVLLRNELMLPGFSLTEKIGKSLPRDAVRLLAFWDYGAAGAKHPLEGEDPNVILSSVGFGVRYRLGEHFAAQFDYGWQQKDPGFPTREMYGRGHVNVTVNW